MKISREPKKVLRCHIPSNNGITCGTDNPATMGCRYYELEGGELAAVFNTDTFHEGHEGVMHGGLSAAILDETMGRCIRHPENGKLLEDGMICVTAEMTVKYRRPIVIGERMVAYGKVQKYDGRIIYTEASIVDENCEIMATAKGKFAKVSKSDFCDSDDEESASKYIPLTEKDPKEL